MSKELYLYCIVNKRIKKSFGFLGFQGQEVCITPYNDISVVAQSCSIKELKKQSQIELAINHQFVMDFVIREFNEAIPFNIGTLIKNKRNLSRLIEVKYKKILSELKEKKAKESYEIQAFYLPVYLQKKPVFLPNIKSFVLLQEQERKLSIQKEVRFKALLLNELTKLTDKIKINNSFNQFSSMECIGNKKILLNLSCLVHKDKAIKFKERLAQINNKKEFSIRLSGPWPAYSFTNIIRK